MRWPSFHGIWFTLGLLLGFVLGWLARPWQAWLQERLRAWRQRRQQASGPSVEELRRAWARVVLPRWQSLHIAATLAPLDAFALPPQVTPLPPLLAPEDDPTIPQAYALWPFLPDAPTLDAAYRAPGLALTEALQGGASLLLIGPYGSGKTVALAWLALRLLYQDQPELTEQNLQWPWWLHADQIGQHALPDDPLTLVFDLLLEGIDRRHADALRSLWREAAQQGTALLLVDGLDEVPPGRRPKVLAFLERMAQVYPRVRMVVAAAPDAWGPLTRLNLQPVAMRAWDAEQAQAFTQRWLAWWEQEGWSDIPPERQPQPEVLAAWLLRDQGSRPVLPMEWVLRNWQLTAGDGVGQDWRALLEGWMRRLVPPEAWEPEVWYRIARRQAFPWTDTNPELQGGDPWQEEPSLRAQALPDALAHPVVRTRFLHPLAQVWWLAQGLPPQDTRWAQDPWWHLQTWLLGFVGQQGRGEPAAQRLLQDVLQPLYPRFWEAGWAVALAPKAPWAREVLQALAQRMQQMGLPVGQRVRAALALLQARPPRLAALFRTLLQHPERSVRVAAILALGLLNDPDAAASALQRVLLQHPSPWERRAALLALARQDTRAAIEAVAEWLLQENDAARREAAEALALAPKWGHQALQEAAGYEDAMVRRAAIYGLARIRAEWARALLQRLAQDDPEWLVRNLAGSVLEALDRPSALTPRPPRPLHREPWLLEAAARLGLSVAAGPPAWQALAHILQEGTPDEQRQALRRVIFLPHERWVPLVASLLRHEDPRVAEDALTTLWFLYWAGTRFPLTL
ncbi:MAG: NACHT domain-containing protein [Chloroflexi bacterium]|nr:NACHT domain-containing protein [Chloroflexota bacterium]